MHFYLANHRSDTVLAVSESDVAETHMQYDAFGNVVAKSGSFGPSYTFSTKEYLPGANVYLYAYRVYDPQAGRWMKRDPIDYQDSVNLYQFCGNNPIGLLAMYGLEISAHDRERLNSFISPADVQQYYNGGILAYDSGGIEGLQKYFAEHARYAYNKDLGWIDMQHVVAASCITRDYFPLAGQLAGYANEIAQLYQYVSGYAFLRAFVISYRHLTLKEALLFAMRNDRAMWENALSFEDMLSHVIGDVAGYKGELPQPLNLLDYTASRTILDK